jgi:DNA polymerase I-like protein with 3'-5' exonuclease and polymerase domains
MAKIVIFLTRADREYIPHLRNVLKGNTVLLSEQVPATFDALRVLVRGAQCDSVATTNVEVAELFVDSKGFKATSLDDYAGSCIVRDGLSCLVLNNLEHIHSKPEGPHLLARYLSKLTHPADWFKASEFVGEVAQSSQELKAAILLFRNADLLAFDYETIHYKLFPDCCGFTGVWFTEDGGFVTRTVTIPHQSAEHQSAIREILANDVPKIAQNGKYDVAYSFRWGIVPRNWLFDTSILFYCWLSELPKRLDFITIYMLRDVKFWKDDGLGTMENRLEYCGRDTWATANACIALLAQMPEWAIQNYKIKYPVTLCSVLPEHTGLLLDPAQMDKMKEVLEQEAAEYKAEIAASIGVPDFNPGSWQQVLKLMHGLGNKDLTSTGPAQMDRFSFRHPLNQWFAEKIKDYKGAIKVVSTYLKDEAQFNDGAGYIWPKLYYALNQTTDTGRGASKASHFWCGFQIQNVKRDEDNEEEMSVKDIVVAEQGFYFGESDLEQAEARDTAYLSGDEKLIHAVDCGKDFHSLNASAFFGRDYRSIYNDEAYYDEDGKYHKAGTVDKPLRNLSKRVNHGSNYNMGAGVLLDTMGIRNVIKARAMLGLNPRWTLHQVCEYLLATYERTYPTVKKDWYDYVVSCIEQTRKLVGPTGWTRYCFGNPRKSKRDLNRYVAHPPQSLNAMVLDQAFVRVHNEIALPNPKDFRLHAQIHDSIFFSYRQNREDLAWKVKEIMEIPVEVKDCKGKTRTLLVPAALKGGGNRWSELKDLRR